MSGSKTCWSFGRSATRRIGWRSSGGRTPKGSSASSWTRTGAGGRSRRQRGSARSSHTRSFGATLARRSTRSSMPGASTGTRSVARTTSSRGARRRRSRAPRPPSRCVSPRRATSSAACRSWTCREAYAGRRRRWTRATRADGRRSRTVRCSVMSGPCARTGRSGRFLRTFGFARSTPSSSCVPPGARWCSSRRGCAAGSPRSPRRRSRARG